jgi:hypothetical protein
MRKHWTTFLVSFLSFVAFACIPAQAQTLCGVAKVNRTGDQVKIKFEGKKDFDGVVIEGAKRSPIKLKSGQLSRSDNKADDLEASSNAQNTPQSVATTALGDVVDGMPTVVINGIRPDLAGSTMGGSSRGVVLYRAPVTVPKQVGNFKRLTGVSRAGSSSCGATASTQGS